MGTMEEMFNPLWGNQGPCHKRKDTEIFKENVKGYSNAGMML